MLKPEVRNSDHLTDLMYERAHRDMSQHIQLCSSSRQWPLDSVCVCVCLTVLYLCAVSRGGARHVVSGGDNLRTVGHSAGGARAVAVLQRRRTEAGGKVLLSRLAQGRYRVGPHWPDGHPVRGARVQRASERRRAQGSPDRGERLPSHIAARQNRGPGRVYL